MKRGEELNQLSRTLFDNAANKWYSAVGLELLAGILACALSFWQSSSDRQKLVGAAAGTCMLIAAYILRQLFESQYDMAETMRRQSVLTEGLGLPIKDSMFSEWRRRAGHRILNRFSLAQRNDDYYVTRKSPGHRRLLEMTQESAFWTRFLYGSLLNIAQLFCLVALLLLASVVLVLLTGSVPQAKEPIIAYGIFLIIPVLLTTNIIGWVIKLRRLIQAICTIENDLDDLAKSARIDEASVLRLVFEYNCQVVAGFPIPSLVFKQNYKKIQREWDASHKKSG